LAPSATSARRCARLRESQAAARCQPLRRYERRWSKTGRHIRRTPSFPSSTEDRVDLRECSLLTTSSFRMLGAQDVDLAMYRAERPNTCHHFHGFAAMGNRRAWRDSRQAGVPVSQSRGRDGRRGLHDELQENRDGDAEWRLRSSILIWTIRNTGLSPGINLSLRSSKPYRVQESGLREIRRKLWRQRLSGRKGGSRSNVEASAGGQHVAIIDCPVDYAENMKLNARLKEPSRPSKPRFAGNSALHRAGESS
jgi:hypothetical protein